MYVSMQTSQMELLKQVRQPTEQDKHDPELE